MIWLVVLAGWTLLVIVFAASSSLTYALTYQPPRWSYTLMMAATEWYAWAALTPAIVWLSRRLPLSREQWWRALILGVVGVPLAVIKVNLTRLLRGIIDGAEAYFQITDLAAQYLIYWGIIAATYAWTAYRDAQARELRTSQLEARLAQTRLQMLSMQLQPHFLFNTLNTIAELVHQRPRDAERMIADLSHLLRETLHAGLVDRVPVDHELLLLQRYIDLQRARFGDRLTVDVSIAVESARRALVPSLLLQPLVENAIEHGIGVRTGAGRIDVVIGRNDDSLLIEIRDDGRGLGGRAIREGVGLGNCRARLETMYGAGAHHLSIANREGGGAIVRLTLPFHLASAQ